MTPSFWALGNSWAGYAPQSLHFDHQFFISDCFRGHPRPLILKPSATPEINVAGQEESGCVHEYLRANLCMLFNAFQTWLKNHTKQLVWFQGGSDVNARFAGHFIKFAREPYLACRVIWDVLEHTHNSREIASTRVVTSQNLVHRHLTTFGYFDYGWTKLEYPYVIPNAGRMVNNLVFLLKHNYVYAAMVRVGGHLSSPSRKSGEG